MAENKINHPGTGARRTAHGKAGLTRTIEMETRLLPVLPETLRYGIYQIRPRPRQRQPQRPTGLYYASPGHRPGNLLKTDSKAPKVRPYSQTPNVALVDYAIVASDE